MHPRVAFEDAIGMEPSLVNRPTGAVPFKCAWRGFQVLKVPGASSARVSRTRASPSSVPSARRRATYAACRRASSAKSVTARFASKSSEELSAAAAGPRARRGCWTRFQQACELCSSPFSWLWRKGSVQGKSSIAGFCQERYTSPTDAATKVRSAQAAPAISRPSVCARLHLQRAL